MCKIQIPVHSAVTPKWVLSWPATPCNNCFISYPAKVVVKSASDSLQQLLAPLFGESGGCRCGTALRHLSAKVVAADVAPHALVILVVRARRDGRT